MDFIQEELKIGAGKWYICIKDWHFPSTHQSFTKGTMFTSKNGLSLVSTSGEAFHNRPTTEYFREATEEEVDDYRRKIYGLMSRKEEEEWERNRKEMHELYEKLSANTKIKFGKTYLCTHSFSVPEPITYCQNVFTEGRKYYCDCPDQLADDHNCRTVIPKDYHKYFTEVI